METDGLEKLVSDLATSGVEAKESAANEHADASVSDAEDDRHSFAEEGLGEDFEEPLGSTPRYLSYTTDFQNSLPNLELSELS